ncbi:MAG: response regulator [Bryobacteraceae bacterium]
MIDPVCLLDLDLPGMDGNEPACPLRKLPQTSQAVPIALTGYGQQQDKDKFFKSGFHSHFGKPMDTGHLRKLLTELAEKSEMAGVRGSYLIIN